MATRTTPARPRPRGPCQRASRGRDAPRVSRGRLAANAHDHLPLGVPLQRGGRVRVRAPAAPGPAADAGARRSCCSACSSPAPAAAPARWSAASPPRLDYDAPRPRPPCVDGEGDRTARNERQEKRGPNHGARPHRQRGPAGPGREDSRAKKEVARAQVVAKHRFRDPQAGAPQARRWRN